MSRLVRINMGFVQVGRCITRTFTTDKVTPQQQKYVDTNDNDHGVRTITMNHPASRNSLSIEMMRSLIDGIKEKENNKDLRSIVITSVQGKVFSAGHNLKHLTIKDKTQHMEVFEICTELMKTIINCPVPIIAAVDGLAAAAGCQLVATCDIVICTERSSFSTPGANFGIFCSTPGIPLVRNVPKKLASYMLFTGFHITGKEAYQAGLVSKVVPDDKLPEEIEKVTNAIHAKSRSVTQLGKKFLYEQMDLDLTSAYECGAEIMVENLKLKDAQEGIDSFIEKRKPTWSHGFNKT